MFVSSNEGRTTIDSAGGQISIRIPTNKNIVLILFLCVWLVGWFMGEKSAIMELFDERLTRSRDFLLVWLCGWTIGGGWAIFSLLWNLIGVENVTVRKGYLKIQKGILGLGLSKEYNLSDAKNFRVVPGKSSFSFFSTKRGMSSWGFIEGPIVFDYGMKTIKFGLGIDEAEARHILGVLQEKGLIEYETNANLNPG